MNNKSIAFVIGGLVVVALIAAFVVYKPTTEPATQTENTEEISSETETQEEVSDRFSGFGSLATFMRDGQSVHCTFASEVEDAISEGSFRYADGKYRVESTSRINGELFTSNMISDGDKVYVWGGSAYGSSAMVFSAADSTDAGDYSNGNHQSQSFDIDTHVDYDCRVWTPDITVFVPPANIDFMDMDAFGESFFEGEVRGMPEGMDLPTEADFEDFIDLQVQ